MIMIMMMNTDYYYEYKIYTIIVKEIVMRK